MPSKIDLKDQVFHRLTVLREDTTKYSPGKIYWDCLCSCGNRTSVSTNALRTGHTKSCGCLCLYRNIQHTIKHGLSKTKVYRSWLGLNSRCYKSKNPDYCYYGGRGISVCERWRHSNPLGFQNFVADMGFPKVNESIDRLSTNGDYTPENCRWATSFDQARNQRSNVLITLNGETHCLSEWSEILGLDYSMIQKRHSKGLLPEEILSPRSKPRRQFLEFNGKTLSIEEWAIAKEISASTLRSRISNNWSTESILTTPAKKKEKQKLIVAK